MTLHPDYPDLVRTALASDFYWQDAPAAEELTTAPELFQATSDLRRNIRLSRDTDAGIHIGNVLSNLNAGGTIEPIEYGESLPVPHGRQILRVVEDSRDIRSKFSPLHWAERITDAYFDREYRKLDPNYTKPTFADNLEAMYGATLTFGSEAESVVNYSLTQVAVIKRAILYMRQDPETGIFQGLASSIAHIPAAWANPRMHLVPDVKVGQIYSKVVSKRNIHLGKIISASIVEATGVEWKDLDDSTKNRPKNKRVKTVVRKPNSLPFGSNTAQDTA